MTGPRSLAASDDGLVGAVETRKRNPDGSLGEIGTAFVRVDFDGNIVAVEELPGHQFYAATISTFDSELYTGGSDAQELAYVARYSSEALPRSPLLTLGNVGPSMPPRLAVLTHDYGAGPVRAAVREAFPGSPKQFVDFSADLKPVGYEKVPDLNNNGYEELAVLSRFPAVVEVRDSLDGSLLSYIKLGERFEPITATVDTSGVAPYIAVVERNIEHGPLADSLARPDGRRSSQYHLLEPEFRSGRHRRNTVAWRLELRDPGGEFRRRLVTQDRDSKRRRHPRTELLDEPGERADRNRAGRWALGAGSVGAQEQYRCARPNVRMIDLQGNYDS